MVCMLPLVLVCKAGKREGLLWKEVDDGTTEMLPHISSVLNVLCGSVLDSSIGLSLDKRKQALWSCNADF